jgi:hypothetical protein
VPTGIAVVKISRVGTMFNESEALAVWPLVSVRVTATVKRPLTVGVPESAPVPALSVMPVGSPVAVQVYGVRPPVAVSVVVAG